jgi:hypothetical protein
VICPRCDLTLPERARFCARCGSPLGKPVAIWVPVLFWAGSIVPLFFAAIYLAVWIDPPAELVKQAATSHLSAQVVSACFAIFFLALLLVQLVAAWALTKARSWARVLATIVCTLWMMTIVGIPLGVIALVAIWSRWENRDRGF